MLAWAARLRANALTQRCMRAGHLQIYFFMNLLLTRGFTLPQIHLSLCCHIVNVDALCVNVLGIRLAEDGHHHTLLSKKLLVILDTFKRI